MRAWILRWLCGRPVIRSLDFSLLGSGVRKWSVQPWAFLMNVENVEMDNSLKCVLFIKVSGQITNDNVIAQDDHLTAGAWAACDPIKS